MTEKYGKCLSPLECREWGEKEIVALFTFILRRTVVFRFRNRCCVCQSKELNRINSAAWKKYEEIKKDINKERKVKRKRYRK